MSVAGRKTHTHNSRRRTLTAIIIIISCVGGLVPLDYLQTTRMEEDKPARKASKE